MTTEKVLGSMWLPPNVTWEMLAVDYNLRNYCYHAFLVALFLIPFRVLILAPFILKPLGRRFGLSDTKPKLTPNAILESKYKKLKRKRIIPDSEIDALSKQTDLSKRSILSWIHARKLQDVPTKVEKFSECVYKSICYSILEIHGIYVLCQGNFLWDTKYAWIGYPQKMTDQEYRHYVVELGWYFHLFITQFTDVKRKDFWETFVHHVAAICLFTCSFKAGLYRIGLLVVTFHDMSDPFLEFAKSVNYCGRKTMAEICFAIMVVVWTFSRQIIYPFRLIYSAVYESGVYSDVPEGTRVFFFVFLFTLFLIDCYWYYLILTIVSQVFKQGQPTRDVRSDSEAESDAESRKPHPTEEDVNQNITSGKSDMNLSDGTMDNGTL